MAHPAQEDRSGLTMPKGGYTLTTESARQMLKIEILGFWDEAVMQAFARDMLAAIRKIDSGENRHTILCDLSRAVIQSQATFEAFRDLLLHGPTQARRLALVTGNLAMRMQAKRVLSFRETISIFACEEDARAWLVERGAV